MALTQEFKTAVAEGNVRLVRIMFKNSLVNDPSLREYREMMSHAQQMPGLFDDHDGTEMDENNSAWTKDYMDELMVEVVYNFSRKRLELLENIVKYIYMGHVAEKRESQPQPFQVPSGSQSQPEQGQTSSQVQSKKHTPSSQPHTKQPESSSQKKIGTGITITGGVMVGAGLVFSQTPLIVVGAVAVVGGIACIALSD